jgi:hypothetical protein
MKRLGEFYREKILSLPEEALDKREIDYSYLPNMRIEKDLFGWKIHYTRPGRKSTRFIECRSEEEARYLKAWIDSGMVEILVPKDDEYIKEILTELEYLKRRTDEILNKWLRTVRNREIKAKLKYEIFFELTEGLGQPHYEPDEDEEENEEEAELEEASEIVDKPVSNDENLLDNF